MLVDLGDPGALFMFFELLILLYLLDSWKRLYYLAFIES